MEDVYDDDEPNLVCCAHVVDLEDDKCANVPDFVTDANNIAEKQRNLKHWEFNCLRYHIMKMEIGADSMMMTFPTNNTLLHHVVSCVAINQDWQKPNRWVNKITKKLIDTDITSIEILKSIIDNGNLNECLDDYDVP
ncbi:hypothetical protein FRACYDRAFT_262961 [Fragilariopsis cylindrus CCMP1102]|uniref:Uncharacterized protein n=1 Tax=Fragilariopsis cylindrus CCMP1102 TaxID=635003 RepID=A0A1E7F346_9STRA|nr:hypothetical protein FRACYDRAFT_262961 [Fragilariopsis cylindrus CCMP1102]|eukprot:OEU12556.1 hypothetical protein FRACYDRAFT_262961 [Fragilariopsis cylindrus CCMP1102]